MPQPAISTNMWFGLAVTFGGHLLLAGVNTMEGMFYSLDTVDRYFNAQCQHWRVGPGLGGGVGVSLYVIVGLGNPWEMSGYHDSGFDFAAALGDQWGAMARDVGLADKAAEIARAMESGGTAFRLLTKLSPNDYYRLAKFVQQSVPVLGIKTDTSVPKAYSFLLPIPGIKLELSGFYQTGHWEVLGAH